MSASLFVPNTLCLYSGLWPPVPLVSAFLSAAGLAPLSSPSFLLPAGGTLLLFQPAGSSTRTAPNYIHLTFWIHISPPAQGG